MGFRHRFTQLHKRSGWTQQRLSDAIKRRTGTHIPQTTISNYLAGVEPSLSNAAAIAATYNVSIEYIAGATDDPRPLTVITDRLAQLAMPPEVERAALLVAQMPPEERAEVAAYMVARHGQWRQLSSLIEFARRMDVDGSLMERIAEISGIDVTGHASPELINDNLFDDGDPGGVNEQLSLLVS